MVWLSRAVLRSYSTGQNSATPLKEDDNYVLSEVAEAMTCVAFTSLDTFSPGDGSHSLF